MSTSDQLGKAAHQLERAEQQAHDAERIRREAQAEWEGGRLPLGLILLSIGGIFTAERLGCLSSRTSGGTGRCSSS